MDYRHGDLVKLAKAGEFDAIVHGCNCQNVMGAGIARQIKKEFPQAFMVDSMRRQTPGTYSCATLPGLKVFNAYTQLYTGEPTPGDTSDMRLVWIRSAFSKIMENVEVSSRIGIPKIGAGLAGGDWEIIEQVIDETCHAHNVTCIIYAG